MTNDDNGPYLWMGVVTLLIYATLVVLSGCLPKQPCVTDWECENYGPVLHCDSSCTTYARGAR